MTKRIFDVCVATLVLVIGAPVWLAIAAAVAISSRGPSLYRGERVGRGGVPFTVLKFRTMVDGAGRQGPGITRSGDPRVTGVGRVLRALKLDEVPQLINVLRGEMSIVGPRPEDPRYVAMHADAYREILTARPGMASPAFIAFRHEEHLLADDDVESHYVHQILPQKLAMDLEYVRTRSFIGDLRVFVAAAVSLVRRPAAPASATAHDAATSR